MKKKFEKPEMKITYIEDVIATSPMVDGILSGVVTYTTQSSGMVGGVMGGNTTFTPQY